MAIGYTVSGTQPVKALLFHLHGAKGKRAQVIKLRPGHGEGKPSAAAPTP